MLSIDNEMVRDIVLARSWPHSQKTERQRISDRTKARSAKVQAKGTRLGPPALDKEIRQRIARMFAVNPEITAYRIAKELRIDPKSAAKYRAVDLGSIRSSLAIR